ncbi:protein FAM81A-like, partial [Conger conger]|uniref:protein FAM81A-like n=1 Tax=Conger conger TaxID=82655 RepID=UPI002A5A83E1
TDRRSSGEIVSSVRRSQGRGPRDERLVLDEHVSSVTTLIQRLSRDIEVLQEKLPTQAEVTYGARSALQRMELLQLAILGDLRGRVARCDANISKLSADLHATREDLQSLDKEQKISKAALETKFQEVETQVSLMCSKVDQSTTLKEARRKPTEGDSSLLDSKLKMITDELKAQIISVQNWMDKEMENTLKEVLNRIEQLSKLIQNKINSNDKAVQEKYSQLAGKLYTLEQTQRERSQRGRDAEQTLKARISRVEQRLWAEVQDLRAETNAGFTIIHASLASLRKVLEVKIRLTHEQLEQQIGQAQRGGAEHSERVG